MKDECLHNVTRLVMGQSKRGRMEEISNGSIVNEILQKSRNMDMIIVPDKFEREGKRILPAKQSVKKKGNPYRSLSPFELEEKLAK